MKIDTIKSGGQSQGGLDNAGGTLSGPLMLSRDPQVPMEAATKRYVDTTLSNLSASNVVSGTLPIARLPAFSGDVTSEAGGNNVVLSNTGITAGEYGKIVVDAKGRATNGTGLGNSDIPNFDFSKITTDKPTTLAGYGITDGISLAGGAMTGPLVLSGSPVSGDNLVPKQYIDGMVNSLSASKTGDVIRKAYATTPAGFLKCNGAEVSKTTYADLYAVIGESNNSYNVIGSGQPWRQQYEINKSQSVDIGNWSTTTALPITLTRSQAIVTKNRVYLIGGNNGSADISTVYTASINVDGTLGTWSTGTSLPAAMKYHTVIVIKNIVYVFYGKTIYTTTINSNGTLGSWITNTTSLPVSILLTQAVITNNRVYLLGGTVNGIPTNTIYTAQINTDGTLGTWSLDTNTLPNGLYESQSIVTKNRVYLLGGEETGGDVPVSTVYTAAINADGTLGVWNITTSLPGNLSESQAVITNNRVYLLGGRVNSSTISNIVYSAPVNADGTLGTWETNTNLSTNLSASQVVIVSNKIYLFGGFTGSSFLSTVYTTSFSGGLNDYSQYYAEDTTNYMMPGSGKPWQQQYQLNESQAGNITGWTAGTGLPTTISSTQAVVTKNRVYLLGGSITQTTYTSSVYTAVINSDGTLGSWSATNSLPGILSHSSCVVVKNRVYLLGGYNGSSSVATIYTAPINSDGTLGTWTTETSLPVAIHGATALVTSKYIYLLGGITGSTGLNTVYKAVINSDGSLGTWTSHIFTLPSPLGNSNIVVVKNRVYLVGGVIGSTVYSVVYTTTINSNGDLGNWYSYTSLPGSFGFSAIFVTKNCVWLFGGHNGSSVVSTVYYATINSDGTLGTWTTGTSLPSINATTSLIAVKNKVYLIGGSSGLSNYSTVYYATISEGLNDYSPYYDGTILPVEPIDSTTTFKLPDMSATDVNGIYHYIKY